MNSDQVGACRREISLNVACNVEGVEIVGHNRVFQGQVDGTAVDDADADIVGNRDVAQGYGSPILIPDAATLIRGRCIAGYGAVLNQPTTANDMESAASLSGGISRDCGALYRQAATAKATVEYATAAATSRIAGDRRVLDGEATAPEVKDRAAVARSPVVGQSAIQK